MIEISLIIPTTKLSLNLINLLEDLSVCNYLSRNDIEIIIIENSNKSNHDLKAKILSYGAQYRFQSKKGQAAALNTGIKAARGRYVAFTDDDVRVLDKDWLDKLKTSFDTNPNLGYVSGNVKAYTTNNSVQKMWENKGGLSKGDVSKYYSKDFFLKKRWKGLPLRFIAAGANSMIPKKVLLEVGNYNELFGCGSPVGHSQSHEICYKVLKAGYTSFYNADAIVHHNHPKTSKKLMKKMYDYGIGDTAIQLHFFMEYSDLGGLTEALFARNLYLINNFCKRVIGKYPLPVKYIISGILGATIGPFIYIKSRITYGNGKIN